MDNKLTSVIDANLHRLRGQTMRELAAELDSSADRDPARAKEDAKLLASVRDAAGDQGDEPGAGGRG